MFFSYLSVLGVPTRVEAVTPQGLSDKACLLIAAGASYMQPKDVSEVVKAGTECFMRAMVKK